MTRATTWRTHLMKQKTGPLSYRLLGKRRSEELKFKLRTNFMFEKTDNDRAHPLTNDDPNLSMIDEDDSVSVPDDTEVNEEQEEVTKHSKEEEKANNDHKEVERLVQKETRDVKLWRGLVAFMLLATAGFVTALTYLFLDREDDEDFRTSFELFANTIENAASFHMKGILQASEGMSNLLTAHAISSNSTWPFVTLPNFEAQAQQLRLTSGCEVLFFIPLVPTKDLTGWGPYSMQNADWILESYETDGIIDTVTPAPFPPFVYNINQNPEGGGPPFYPEDGSSYNMSAPVWQLSPPPSNGTIVNYNFLSQPWLKPTFEAMMKARGMVFAYAGDSGPWRNILMSTAIHDSFHAEFLEGEQVPGFANSHPHSSSLFPVFKEFKNPESEIVGYVSSLLPWDRYLQNLLPEGARGITAVLRNSCNQSYYYKLDGPEAKFNGTENILDPKFEKYERVIDLHSIVTKGRENVTSPADCFYSFSIYPEQEMLDIYDTKTPLALALVVATTFFLMSLTFFIYEQFVQKKNLKIIGTAARTNKIVASLFPANVRDRLLAAEQEEERKRKKEQKKKGSLNNFFSSGDDGAQPSTEMGKKDEQIADFFSATTILFADIVGFTAWSSVREPTQVFTLLETLYGAFDEIARKRGVFKVETVGDCYVAVTGLPSPRADHAVAMARFASDAMKKMHTLTRKMEITLGPDTGELSMRFGLHSGPVTAGVLRGEGSRYQLFGDTMNTASRMETTSTRGRIQMSTETAQILIAAGKRHWLSKREDAVMAKGKGMMETYWLEISKSSNGNCSMTASTYDKSDASSTGIDDNVEDENGISIAKRQRLVDWNAQVLEKALRNIAAFKGPSGSCTCSGEVLREVFGPRSGEAKMVIDEVSPVLSFPKTTSPKKNADDVPLSKEVSLQIKNFVATIADLYPNHSFHGFEHASHVSMSILKLLSRFEKQNEEIAAAAMISADPLILFVCIFVGLIHDVDHTGVGNAVLIKENDPLAAMYRHQSIAEQNSVETAFGVLCRDDFAELRAAIYHNDLSEMRRFRQLVVNLVMATDIMDKDLNKYRDERWQQAFSQESGSPEQQATVVLEHLVQASDVAHTMQHWHIYRKWNECLFDEMSTAYAASRTATDPASTWYQGELGFFDFYIIPLARKLKACGVFGTSGDEYLNYAEQNRAEWELRGKDIVTEMVDSKKTLVQL